MARVYAPVNGYNGISAGVAFKDGAAEVEKPELVAWFKDHGYQVEKPISRRNKKED